MAEPIVEPSASAGGPPSEPTESTPAETATRRAGLADDRPASGDLTAPRSEGTLRAGMVLVRELVGLHPLPFTVAVIGAAIYAGATVGSTVVLGRITDRVVFPAFDTGQLPSRALLWGVVAMLAVTVLRVSGVVARRYFAGMTSERGQRTFRRRLGDRYLSLPMSWHQATPAGQLLAHVDNDAEISTEFLHPLPFSLGVAFLALFSAISLLVIDVWLALVAFLIFPALVTLNRVYSRRIEKPAADVQAAVGRVSSVAHESFDGALVVKTLGRAEAEGQRFDGAAQALRGHRVRVGYIRAVFESVMEALPSLGIVLVVVFGTWRIEADAITRGDLVQVAALFTVLAFPLRVLGFFLEMVPPSVVSRRRLETVFDQPDPPAPEFPQHLPDGPLGASLRDVSFRYPGDPDGPLVLDRVDLTVEPGEVVAVVGSTGAGKSTLCSLIAGLVPPTSGHIEIGGRPIGSIDAAERADAVALVFQESFLFADTLRANVDLAGRSGDGTTELDRVAAVAQVDEFVDRLPDRWDTVVGERGVTLSGGQRQRVALARALIRRPRLLLLDDATSAVDPKIELQILDALRSGQPTSTLIVAQRVSTITLADRVLYLADGRIAAAGTHQELLADPGYRALVTAYEQGAR